MDLQQNLRQRARQVTLFYIKCSQVLENYTAKTITAFDVNKRLVQSFSKFDKGCDAVEQFCLGINMGDKGHSAYCSNMTDISKEAGVSATGILYDAKKCVKCVHVQEKSDHESKHLMDVSLNCAKSYVWSHTRKKHHSDSGPPAMEMEAADNIWRWDFGTLHSS
jgi:hypothetical protein